MITRNSLLNVPTDELIQRADSESPLARELAARLERVLANTEKAFVELLLLVESIPCETEDEEKTALKDIVEKMKEFCEGAMDDIEDIAEDTTDGYSPPTSRLL